MRVNREKKHLAGSHSVSSPQSLHPYVGMATEWRDSMQSGASEPSAVGIFWGGDVMVTARTSCNSATRNGRAHLPPLPKSLVVDRSCPREELTGSLSSPSLSQPARRDNASQTLIGVLQTLHRSIQQDVIQFTSKDRAFDLLSATSASMGSPGKQYFSVAVESEDRDYFIKERATEANWEVVHAHVSLSVRTILSVRSEEHLDKSWSTSGQLGSEDALCSRRPAALSL